MQFFHLAWQFIRNPITFIFDSLLLLNKSFSINLALLQDKLIELQAKHYELLNNDFIRFWRFIQKPTIKLLATRILSLFSSTYDCEASFFVLNNFALSTIKSKRRSRFLRRRRRIFCDLLSFVLFQFGAWLLISIDR